MKRIITCLFISLMFGCSSENDDNQNPCAKPVDLNVINITNTTATLDWNSVVTSSLYTVEYGAFGFMQGSGTIISTADNFVIVDELLPQTQYSFYVSVFCSESNNNSDWAGPYAFVTFENNPFCDDPTDFAVNDFPGAIGMNSIELVWANTGFSGVQIEYGISGFDLGNGTIVFAGDNSTIIDNLEGDTTYDFYVRNNCEESGFSSWVGPINATTATNNCIAPSEFVFLNSGISPGGIRFIQMQWEGNGQTNWDIQVVENGAPIGTDEIQFLNQSSTFIQINASSSGLNPGDPYDFYVRANCGSEGDSAWTGPLIVTSP